MGSRFQPRYEFNDLRIPESVEEGVWYFIVWLDAESEIDEINEGNNIAVTQFTVVSNDMPDVYVTNLSTTPNVVQPLSFIEGLFEIGNSGKAEMPTSHYRYAISKDGYYSGDDYTISYNELTGMNAGYVNNQASTGDFQLPENIGVGDWYLLVMLDCDAEIDEDNEGNNMAVAEFSVASPDLYVNFQTVYTNSVMPGDLFRADIEYGNQGQLASLPGKIKYFLSRDEIVSSEDLVLMESNPQLAWAAGYYQQYELNDLRMPETTEGGIWFIIASVDNDEEINEVIEDNNIAYVQVVVSPTQPVLVLSESRMALAYQAGTTSFQISNSGTGNLTWSLSVVEGREWLQIENDETSGSGEKTIVLNYDINSGCDSRNAILQIQSNAINSSVTSISITQESDPTHVVDLAIYDFTAELNCPQVSVNVSINNIGGCLSQGTKVEYFLCSSASCTNPLSFLGSSDCDPILNGESLTIQECIVLDGIEDGTYFLAAKIDPNDEVFENNEENNVSFYEISINSTGIEKNLLEKALTVYPNPTSDWVTVSLDGSNSPSGRLTVVDQVGRVVDQFVIDELLSWEIIIDTRKWDAGIYSLLLNAGDELVYRKLVVR